MRTVDRAAFVRRPLLQLLRPTHWVKNGFVLAPWIFTAGFLDRTATLRIGWAFLAFCLASSASYVLNDLLDVEADRRHPVKRLSRPIAADLVSRRQAITVLLIVLALLAASLVLQPAVVPVIVGYVALNVAYSRVLKHIPVVDLFALAASFVLRIYAGGRALDVPISFWMFVTTVCVALHLAAIKRRQELVTSGAEGRAVLTRYSVALLDYYAMVAAVGAIIFYSLFVHSVRPALLPTIPVVLYGFFRYRYLVEVEGSGESPTDLLLLDPHLVAAVLVWLALCVWAMLGA